MEPEGRGDGTGQQAEGGCGMCTGGCKRDVTCIEVRRAMESRSAPRRLERSFTNAPQKLVLEGGHATGDARPLNSLPAGQATGAEHANQ